MERERAYRLPQQWREDTGLDRDTGYESAQWEDFPGYNEVSWLMGEGLKKGKDIVSRIASSFETPTPTPSNSMRANRERWSPIPGMNYPEFRYVNKGGQYLWSYTTPDGVEYNAPINTFSKDKFIKLIAEEETKRSMR